MVRLGPVLGASLLAWPGVAAADVDAKDLPYARANLTFGAALAADGQRLAVGAPGDNEAGFDAGAVYLYSRDGDDWALRQRLRPESGAYQHFGSALALDGETLLVGGAEPLADGGSRGVGHLYEVDDGEFTPRERWVLDDSASLGYLGVSVALDGDTLALGAYFAMTTPTTRGGRIRVMHRAGGAWIEEADLRAEPGQLLGESLALDGEWLFALAEFGARVAVYRRDAGEWRAQADLELPGADLFDGAEALVSDDGALVLADTRSPRLYFYGLEDGGWRPRDTVDFDGDEYSNGYGEALAIGGGRVGYTTTRETFDPEFSNVETVHVLRREGDGWVADGEVAFAVDDHEFREAFGGALALAGDWLIAGAPEYGEHGWERSGRAHTFTGADWAPRQVLVPDDPLVEGCGCRGGTAPGWCVLFVLLPRRRRKP